MEWTDEAIILSMRSHGESSAIVEALTHYHGRHMGLVRGGGARRGKAMLQPGNTVQLSWRARLEDHLGHFTVETLRSRAGDMLESRESLIGLNAVSAMAAAALPERESHANIFEATELLLDAIQQDDLIHWAALYIRWEAGLLEALGFGLDLTRCAVTGDRDDLRYVSPRTGRAVSAVAGAAYADRIFRLPAFLLASQNAEPSRADIADGLKLTEFFLHSRILAPHHRQIPGPRQRLNELLGESG